MCGCWTNDAETSHADDGPPWVDVPVAIEINADLIREDPEIDHISICPVAICGHMGRAQIRELVRGAELPAEEWFELGEWMGDDTAAVLFICRSHDFRIVGDDDLEMARGLAEYARSNPVLPWDLVFVTERGNFSASDLLGLPGLPEFEPCTFTGWEEQRA
jgi:hypothetical protein